MVGQGEYLYLPACSTMHAIQWYELERRVSRNVATCAVVVRYHPRLRHGNQRRGAKR